MRTDRHRAKYIRWVRKRALLALNRQLKYFIDRRILTEEGVETFIQEDEIRDMFRDIYTTVGRAFAKETNKKLLQKKSEFNEGWFQKEVEDWLALEGDEAIAAVTSYSKDKIKTIIARGIERGVTINQMAAYIRTEIRETYRNRALTIARTETVAASNFGAMRGAEMTGLSLNKIWITALDDRTRDSHTALNGLKVDQKEVFTDPVTGERLAYPGDRANGASLANVVNCRCALGFEKK